MGDSLYSSDTYRQRIASSNASPSGYFKHSAKIASGEVQAKVHPLLDPARVNKAGVVVRESIDSDVHPTSVAVAVLFDVTGSMTSVPKAFVKKLGDLMQQITTTALPHPHVLFGAVGDAYTDTTPLQVGQFEGGNAMDESLSQLYLEGKGGGNRHESYELAMYFMARKSIMDCLNKRKKKGYLFLLGDETPYGKVDARVVKEVIGDDIPADISLASILKELQEKFEVFWITPAGTQYWEDKDIVSRNADLFGSRYLRLDIPENVSEVITATIAICEGKTLTEAVAHLEKSQQECVIRTLENYYTSRTSTVAPLTRF